MNNALETTTQYESIMQAIELLERARMQQRIIGSLNPAWVMLYNAAQHLGREAKVLLCPTYDKPLSMACTLRKYANGDADRPHVSDSDCTVDPTSNCCIECGVEHDDPCPDCGQRAFHTEGCFLGGRA